jgi:membrane-bound lytic murein transglycosylase A
MAPSAPPQPLLPASPPVAPPSPSPAPLPAAPAARYERATWSDLPEWGNGNQSDAWPAWQRGCNALRQPVWQRLCAASTLIRNDDALAWQRFFEDNFTPYRLANPDGSTSGLVTGYYEPLLLGSRKRTARFRFPLYAPPPDLVAIDIVELNPELKDRRVRGRVLPTPQGAKVVPYYDRAAIGAGQAPVKGLEIAWVEDPVELFFLQVQGSGRIRLADGSLMRVGYADHNGHPYRSIGRWLIDAGELPPDQASMQGIKAWVKRNPERVNELLNQNPAFVFFREMPAGASDDGPVGSLNVPLTAGRSIAVDPRAIPLGAPVFLATTWPLSPRSLSRLMFAQDTGSAIRGVVRADLFWGFGAEAAERAGRMNRREDVAVVAERRAVACRIAALRHPCGGIIERFARLRTYTSRGVCGGRPAGAGEDWSMMNGLFGRGQCAARIIGAVLLGIMAALGSVAAEAGPSRQVPRPVGQDDARRGGL